MEKLLLLEDLEKAENKTLYCTFDEKIEGIECVTPIHAFNHDLDSEIDEMFSKHSLLGDYEESGQEFEIKDGQFVTDLNGAKEIDIYDLLYQSVILNLPNKKVCGINCKGRQFLTEEDTTDPRLDVFKDILINPKNS